MIISCALFGLALAGMFDLLAPARIAARVTLATAPYWVKLVRAGDAITGYASVDGATWTEVGSDTFTMGSTIYVGLAVSRHVSGTNATATFDNVTITPGG